MNFLPFIVSILIYFSATAISVLIIKSAERRNSKLLAAVGVLVPVIVATFRTSGVDFISYERMYDYIHNAGINYPTELGWKLLNMISPSFRVVLFLAALIFFGVSYIAIRKFDAKYRWMSWLVVLVVSTGAFYNVTRQAIASAFVFLALAFFYKKKYFRFVVCVALGALFHKTALIMLIFLPLYWLIMKRIKKLGLFTLIMSAIAMASVPIMVIALERLGLFLTYIENMRFEFSILFLFYVIPPVLFYAVKPNIFKDNKLLHYCLALYIFVIPMQFLGMMIPYADRIMLYFRPALAIAVPLIIQGYAEKSKIKGANVCRLYVVWFIVYHLIMGVLLNENGIYPYISF